MGSSPTRSRRQVVTLRTAVGFGAGLFVLVGCFQPRLQPAQYQALTPSAQTWVLQDDVKASLESGWSSPLKKGTTWRQIGRIEQGDVITTGDQVVTVERSNMYEAAPVVANGRLVGFFLMVERAFTPADPAVPINLQPKTR